jgi:hypothetical protein
MKCDRTAKFEKDKISRLCNQDNMPAEHFKKLKVK